MACSSHVRRRVLYKVTTQPVQTLRSSLQSMRRRRMSCCQVLQGMMVLQQDPLQALLLAALSTGMRRAAQPVNSSLWLRSSNRQLQPGAASTCQLLHLLLVDLRSRML